MSSHLSLPCYPEDRMPTPKTSPSPTRSASTSGDLSLYVGYHLRMAHNQVFRRLDQALAELQLTTAMYGVLALLSSTETIPQGQLARSVGLTTPSMVPLADKLEARGWVSRTRQTHDRRTVYLCLTPEGRKHWAKAARVVSKHEAALRSNLSKDETAELIRLLGQLTSK